MILFFLIGIVITFIFFLYERYFPVFGVNCINCKDLDLDKINIIDIRDFNDSYKNLIEGATNMPFAYLKRNLNQVPNSDVHLIVSSTLEKNIGTRYLRRMGFPVVGYTIINHSKVLLKENGLNIETYC
ncbi:hypothetical protein COJ85_21850 [Bacillus sp. AFS076308]|uniref:hypothetical protein n=1 Tax=unclassified Bacillus (in: firmicutes) TaxID=185979 RepID=UPI000BFA851E|nr:MULTISPECIES: hypothetical protein [unclassified Bacillus (in: firmicutes)]PFN98164.1 hypothetical protein COJ85_21850 [Bacillus sp. AFS076308]PGV50879.1 hypothetical protein COD92_16470 [Bacillus sp. AFS037270]